MNWMKYDGISHEVTLHLCSRPIRLWRLHEEAPREDLEQDE